MVRTKRGRGIHQRIIEARASKMNTYRYLPTSYNLAKGSAKPRHCGSDLFAGWPLSGVLQDYLDHRPAPLLQVCRILARHSLRSYRRQSASVRQMPPVSMIDNVKGMREVNGVPVAYCTYHASVRYISAAAQKALAICALSSITRSDVSPSCSCYCC